MRRALAAQIQLQELVVRKKANMVQQFFSPNTATKFGPNLVRDNSSKLMSKLASNDESKPS